MSGESGREEEPPISEYQKQDFIDEFTAIFENLDTEPAPAHLHKAIDQKDVKSMHTSYMAGDAYEKFVGLSVVCGLHEQHRKFDTYYVTREALVWGEEKNEGGVVYRPETTYGILEVPLNHPGILESREAYVLHQSDICIRSGDQEEWHTIDVKAENMPTVIAEHLTAEAILDAQSNRSRPQRYEFLESDFEDVMDPLAAIREQTVLEAEGKT